MNKINKKGNAVVDTGFVFVVLIVMSVISVICYKVLADVNTGIQASDMTTESKTISSTWTTNYPSMVDNIFIIIFAVLWIMIIAASLMINSHPFFMIIAVILLALLLFAATFISNFVITLQDTPELVDYALAMPMMYFVMNHMIMILTAMGFSVILALYARSAL